jgi:Tfp pilus assembly protein PilO
MRMSVGERVALLLAGILLVSAWILIVAPERERARHAARELAQLDAQILSAEQVMRTLVSTEREIREGKERLQRLQGRLLGTRNLERILIVLSRNAEELGVKIVSMRPLGERAPSASVPTRQFPVEMELRGRFLDLGRYLEGLRAAPLLLTVEGVRLTRADTDSRLALRMVAVTHIRPRGQ